MRKGYGPSLIFNKKGKIVGFSTGSDACAEHEVGIKPLLITLCGSGSPVPHPITGVPISPREFEVFARGEEWHINRGCREFFEAYFKGEKDIQFPSLLEQRSIKSNLDMLSVVDFNDRDGVPCLMLLCKDKANERERVFNEILPFQQNASNPSKAKGEFVTSGWDKDSFAFAVKGEVLVRKFREFTNEVLQGGAVFAGSFAEAIDSVHSSGITLFLSSAIRPEHRQAIREAQEAYEAGIIGASSKWAVKEMMESHPKLEGILKHSSIWPEGDFLRTKKRAGESLLPYQALRAQKVLPEVTFGINPSHALSGQIESSFRLTKEDFIAFANGEVKKLGGRKSLPPRPAGTAKMGPGSGI